MLKKVYLVTILVTLAFLLLPSKILGQGRDVVNTLTGNIIVESDFSSKTLANKRNIIIYLPPNYKQNSKIHYPVLYLHDGQNVFDQTTSFIGQEWQCDETAEKLILANKIQPIIIVGIYNAGEKRVDEYTPSIDVRYGKGGKANLYSKFLIEELKPFIDKKYRTLKDPANTALGGSSLGGLVSLFIGLQHPQIFGKLAIVSPSVWWDNKVILKDVENLPSKPKTKIWLDIGSKEGEESIPDTNSLKEALVNKGWQLNKDLKYLVIDGAKHNEEAWANRFDKILEFLFPKK